MSNVYDGADFETEAIIIPTVKGIHRELLEENIKNQIENPFTSSTNYVETFNSQISDIIDEEEIEDGSDAMKAINNERISFYASVIDLVDNSVSNVISIQSWIRTSKKSAISVKHCTTSSSPSARRTSRI